MSLQRHVEFACQTRAFSQKFVRAVQRNRRAESRPDPTPVETQIRQNPGASISRRLPWPRTEARISGADVVGQRFKKLGQLFVDCLVGDHRCYNGSHARVAVGTPDGGNSLGRGERKFRGEIVAGGAALADHLRGGKGGAKVLVLHTARLRAGCAAGEKHFKRDLIVNSPPVERAMRMRMGTDQAWYQ